jgi:hypothetical protein
MNETISRYAASLGQGLIAGLAGTAAMTISSAIEMKVRGRSASQTPARAICEALGLETKSEQAQGRLTSLVHWAYGTAWGAVRGIIAATGTGGAPANLIYLGLLWSVEQIMLPKLGVAPPLTEQEPEEIIIDGCHHFVYAQATGLTYDELFTPENAIHAAGRFRNSNSPRAV